MSYPYRAIKQCLKDLNGKKVDYVALGAKGYSYESILANIYKLSVNELNIKKIPPNINNSLVFIVIFPPYYYLFR